ncbi:DUF2339 domain-containing protein [Parasphingorhabdus pacifica]
MTTRQTTQQSTRPRTDEPGETITRPIEDIATMFADMSTELGRFSEQILERLADVETTRGEPDHSPESGSASDRLPPPTRARRAVPVPLLGEPVDTSFTRPTSTPDALNSWVYPRGEPVDTSFTRPTSTPDALNSWVYPRGEPVDTSFAPSTRTPVAQAAGVDPHQGGPWPDRSLQGESGAAARSRAEPNPASRTPHPPAAEPSTAGPSAAEQAAGPQATGRGPAVPEPPVFDRVLHWTSRHGIRLLAWSGGAVTLLGIVLLLVMAVQQGWLGPLGRVVGGAALGLALPIAGRHVHRRSAAGMSAALVATGIATLYLDVIAATALYGFLPPPGGLVAALALAGGGLWIADRWTSQPLAVGVVLGCAVCAPLLFGSQLGAPGTSMALLTGFLVMLKLAAMPVQMRRGWPVLTVVSALPAVLSALVANAHAATVGPPWPAAWAATTVAVTGIALAVITSTRRPRDPVSIVLLLAAGSPALLVAPLLPRWAGSVVVGIVIVLYAAVWLGQRLLFNRLVPRPLGIAAGGAAALALLQLSVTALDGSARSPALLAQSVALGILAVRLRGKGILLTALVYGGSGALLAATLDVPPMLFTSFPAEPYIVDGLIRWGSVLPGIAAFALIGLAALVLTRSAVGLGVVPPRHPGLLLPAAALLYGSGGAVLSSFLAIAPTTTGFLAGHGAITVSWLLAAFVLLLRGLRSGPHRLAGFVLIFTALAKLALFDVSALDGFARVGTFLAAGLLLLAGGTWYARRIADRQTPDGQTPDGQTPDGQTPDGQTADRQTADRPADPVDSRHDPRGGDTAR